MIESPDVHTLRAKNLELQARIDELQERLAQFQLNRRDSSTEDLATLGPPTSTKTEEEDGHPIKNSSLIRQRKKVSPDNDNSLEKQQVQIQKPEQQQKNYILRPSVPAHRRPKESPLSSNAIFKQSHAGLFNLCIVVLVAVNSRLIIENLLKYGLLIQMGLLFSSKSWKDWPLFMCGLSLPVFPLSAYLIEKLKSQARVSDGLVAGLHVINLVFAIGYPIYIIEKYESDVLSGVVLMLVVITGWLKLVSYAHTNADTQLGWETRHSGGCTGPGISPQHLPGQHGIFHDGPDAVLPAKLSPVGRLSKELGTLATWEVDRLQRVHHRTFIINNSFIIGQYMNPIIRNSTHPLKGNYLNGVERVLKLSIPTLYVWLGFFYCFFHLWLNMVAELLRFGDREFYKDWWNAKTVDEYWRLWNKWLVRHVYFPCIGLLQK